MGTLARPAIVRPEYQIDQNEMVQVLQKLYPHHPQWDKIHRMITNTQVFNRYLVCPIEEIVQHKGFEQRNLIYADEAKRLGIRAVKKALAMADLDASAIDMIIVTSCTGFMMPSLTAHLISNLPFRPDTKQLPIAQLGCVAGASAINRAFEYCRACNGANVLIVSVEFCSLCFQPSDNSISDLLSSVLFGDSVSACVMRGQGGTGYRVEDTTSFLLKHSERYIAYDVKSTGFHFVLDKKVMNTIKSVAPIMKELSQKSTGLMPHELDFYIFHTGGRRILDELVIQLEIDEKQIDSSRRSLAECGNLSSVVVFDVLDRMFDNRMNGEQGMLAAFGPGFTTEINTGVWVA